MSWRVLLAITLLGAFVAAIAFLGEGAAERGDPSSSVPVNGAGDPRGALAVDASSCQECHPEIYAQWASSQHHHAYLNPDVRETSADLTNQNCIPCHAPRPIFELGLEAMPRSRSVHREQGVSCLSCHLIPGSTTADGQPRLAGSRDLPAGTCGLPVVKTPSLGTYRSCEPCHNQHETTNQWKETPYAQEGAGFRSCADCHMTRREFSIAKGTAPQLAWDHTMPGSHDREYILSALDIDAGLAGEALRVAITNARAGHHFPTEERSRAVDVMVEWQDAEGRALGEPQKLYRFRDPYRGEQGITRTLLPHGETWSQTIEKGAQPAGAKRARVWVDYLRKPYEPVPETHRYRLFERTVDLP
jgi:nitrate/TMAO reductase-like tetraheme cytochrome c subunit